MVGIVHVGNGLTERLDTGGRSIFSGSDSDVDVRGPLEAAFDVILDLDLETYRSALLVQTSSSSLLTKLASLL